MKAAQLAYVAPWELAKQPIYWTKRIMVLAAAEAEAQEAGKPKKIS